VPPPLSSGILLFRRGGGDTEVLLIRPGGPYWTKRQEGAWMIPKGGVDEGESAEQAAFREYEEELGSPLEAAVFRLCRVKQSGGKLVEVFAAEGDFDISLLNSSKFEMEWPPRSGQLKRYPEAEEARWMTLEQARRMMLPSQLPMLDALEQKLQEIR
jgi:predicted NUDIX family NTP pyrophosphohydrolase